MVKKNQEECKNYILTSLNHEMYLQEVKKSMIKDVI